MDLDSTKQGTLNYYDFSKWMGDAIHIREGFYFRHDSQKNPAFDDNEAKNELLHGVNNKERRSDLYEIEKEIINKFEF